ncbi:YadA C-terminal domain-containing protein [Providencia rustigianii]|nr:YadA C-terminal domain-containing protein [Providencia rustigianii]SUC26588.1 YadA-like C-terminal region [Providencia rustigianii]
MKNKILLCNLSTIILTSLFSQSFASNDYNMKINAPYDYPEHRHEDNSYNIKMDDNAISLNDDTVNKNTPINISTILDDAITLFIVQPHLQELDNKEVNTTYTDNTPNFLNTDDESWAFIHSMQRMIDVNKDHTNKNKQYIDNIKTSVEDLTNDINSNKSKHEKNENDINELIDSISKLTQNTKDSENRSQRYADREIADYEEYTKEAIEISYRKNHDEIEKLNTAILELNTEIKNTDELTSLSIDEAEKNSKAHADLILRNQQMLNIERFDKIDKQNNLHTRQFKQINTKFDHLESKINQTARDANAGIAAVAAMTNIPYTSGTRFSAGLGMGNFKNGKAIAAGAQYQVKQNLNLRSSISWNNSDSAVIGAGVAYGW